LRKLVLIFIVLISQRSWAQVLLPTPETGFEKQHHFNPAVIAANNIRKITYEIIDKKDFEIAVDKNLVETYEFNDKGFLQRYYYTVVSKCIERQVMGRRGKIHSTTDYLYDTVSTTFFYSPDNKLILQRYHDGISYYESRYYRYNSNGLLTKELRYKETNASSDRGFFILGNQVLMSEDSLQYQKFASGQIKCTMLNNENRPYKERIINTDSAGRWVSVSEFYTAAAWITQNYSFTYNGKRLTAAKFEGNTGNSTALFNTYEYDSNNELYTEKQHRNDVLIKEISYVADRGNGLLNSFVVRDPLSRTMRIVKLKYDSGQMGKTAPAAN
jgi:hypothetical protein